MDISRPCQPEKLIPLLPSPNSDPSFAFRKIGFAALRRKSEIKLGLWRVDEYSGTGTVWSRNRFQNREPSTCLFLLIRMIGACKQTGSCWNDRMFCCDRCCCCWGSFLLPIGAPARLHESWNSLVSLVHRPIDLRSAIGKRKGAGTSLLSNLAHIEMLHNNKMRITFIVMAAPLWTLIRQLKSDYIQAVAQEIIKIWIFYIYMNIYLHVKVFIFVPGVDFNIIISHLSDNISYYKMFTHKHTM